MKKTFIGAVLAATVVAGAVRAAEPAAKDFTKESPQERAARMAWFNEARFGMFIHWGLYAVPAGEWNGKPVDGIGEWIMNRAKIPLAEYRPLVQQFNPSKYDPAEWARIAKGAGMRYVVITSKHHDGFCLWDSKETTYDAASTPHGKDLLRPLADAVRAEGLTMCFYHSIMDWQHPNYEPLASWDKAREGHQPDMNAYVKYLKAQLRELVQDYGPVGIMWFDGEWEASWTHERGVDLYNYVRGLQPSILVNNRVDKGRKGMVGMNSEGDFAGDYGTPEQEIPPRGFPEGVYWESCMTMNDTWGYKKNDSKWKSSQDLIRKLADIASKGGNYLLNVGPKADGTFPPEIVERLAAMGEWMKVNGESIYGTSATPFQRLPFRCTKRPGVLYVHVFDRPADGLVALPGLKNAVKSARLLAGGATLAVAAKNGVTTIALPATLPDANDTVVAVAVDGLPEAAPTPLGQGPDGSLELSAFDARVHGSTLKYEESGDNLGFWTNDRDWAEWSFKVTMPGTFDVVVTYACDAKSAGGVYQVKLVDQVLDGKIESTGKWTKFKTVSAGRFIIAEPGEWSLGLRGRKAPGAEGLMNVRSVKLTPAK
jgi:alpha-L-fucosidase